MGWKSTVIRPYAAHLSRQIKKWKGTAVADQKATLIRLMRKASQTAFGSDHGFSEIKSHQDFIERVPVRDYEQLRTYVDRMVDGQPDILWPGKPKYYAKTSGTTSGVKYIPITHHSMPSHISAARSAMMNYVHQSGNAGIFDGKMIFLSGSPELTKKAGVDMGRLSGIVNHEVPSWVKGNQLPSYDTNCIEDWEPKLQKILDETLQHDMRLISGIPPWVQMYYEQLLIRTGKSTVLEVFPNFSLFMYGGVNYSPYKQKLEELIGKKIDSIETYPASEGFIAFQDRLGDPGLLLNTDAGMFYEFVPAQEIWNEKPTRLGLEEVEIDVDYAILISSNAGLWAYNIGDMVRFVSLDPYKVVVSGRVKHFISAFGEHVIGKEVESAMLEVSARNQVKVVEFTVAPQVQTPQDVLPYHEWFIEFDGFPDDIDAFASELDDAMVRQNIYYRDLIDGKILQPLKIAPLEKGAFRSYMKSIGKLGGQNKVPRLSNDRNLASPLQSYLHI